MAITLPFDAPLCASPDRKPRPPAVGLPEGATDCHAHICGPAERFPYAKGRVYTPPDATLADYLQLLKTLRVDRAVLVQPSVYGTDNRALIEALQTVGAGLRGIAVVDPDIAPSGIQSLHRAGIRGLRFNLVDRRDGRNQVPVDVLKPLARRIAPFGWHFEFLVNLDQAEGFADAVADLPVPIVLGHLGYPGAGAAAWLAAPGFADLARMLEGGRCWVKLTGPYRISHDPDLPYADVDPVAARLAALAPHRLIWGSDWPHVMMQKPMPNDGPLCDLLARWIPDAVTRQRILVANPAELYGFETTERLTR
jgi:2-pyrone-4,6-dicarboxylate lactonase